MPSSPPDDDSAVPPRRLTPEELARWMAGAMANGDGDGADSYAASFVDMNRRLLALELQQDEEAQIDTEARRAANAMTLERVREIAWLRWTRLAASLGAGFVVLGFMGSFGYALLWDGGRIIAALQDPWVKLAFITGHLVLIGLVVTILLKALYSPGSKDDSNATLLEAFKTVVNATKE